MKKKCKESVNFTKTYGLIGYPLSHSFSEKYFTKKFTDLGLSNYCYRPIEINDISEIRKVLQDIEGFSGFNVTIPHKRSVMDYLDAVSPVASEIGAVNCVDIKDGIWTGYNTDAIGFEITLQDFLLEHGCDLPEQTLVLGNGGSSKAVQWVLKNLNLEYVVASTKDTDNTIRYHEINSRTIKKFDLIVNTTPLGMYPFTERAPELPYESLTSKQLLYDLIYNPEKSLFLTRGLAHGCRVTNGMKMLTEQAEASWKIWNN